MCPTARPNQVEPLIPWRPAYLNPHIRYPPLRLPSSEILLNLRLYQTLSPQVVRRHGSELVVVGLTFALLLRAHPLDTVQALLKDIVWLRLVVRDKIGRASCRERV